MQLQTVDRGFVLFEKAQRYIMICCILCINDMAFHDGIRNLKTVLRADTILVLHSAFDDKL